MLMYTENDTESDKRIKNNNFIYKRHQTYKNTFPKKRKSNNVQKQKYLEIIRGKTCKCAVPVFTVLTINSTSTNLIFRTHPQRNSMFYGFGIHFNSHIGLAPPNQALRIPRPLQNVPKTNPKAMM